MIGQSITFESLPLILLLSRKHNLEVTDFNVTKDNYMRISLTLKGSNENMQAYSEDLDYQVKYSDAIDKILKM